MKPRLRSILLVSGLALVCALGAAGCKKPLLSPDEERSQYDRYDAVRNQRAPQYVFDEFGRRRPALRERLLPKD
jgi:hypothetical protein